MTREIQLANGNDVALVDDEDFLLVSQYSWCSQLGYARAYKYHNGGRTTFTMHRLIMGGLVDHINGNGLDNRRENLRLCTHLQNMGNRKTPTTNKSGYKGVSHCGRKWRAEAMCKYEHYYLGIFEDKESAARAYDQKAIELWGEFARTNFPKENYQQTRSSAVEQSPDKG